MPKKMYVVSRAKPELHERLSTYFAADDATKVVLDRRQGERRGPETAAPGRRRRDLSGDLQNRGWAIIELNGSQEVSTEARVRAEVASVVAVIEGRTPAAVAALGAQPRSISHFPYAIERCGEVGLSSVDATSRLGTVVNGVRIGGSSGRRRATLKPGTNEIALGGPGTPYIFNVVLSTAAI